MSLTLDPQTTALVLIDMQQGVLSLPLQPYGKDVMLEKTVALGRHFEKVGAMIVLVTVAFSPTSADRLNQPVDAPMQGGPGAPPPDWALLAPEVDALRADVKITKRQWGAFFGTELDLQLRRRGIKTIVLGGVATNFGVEQTAREAWQHNYAVVVAEDAATSIGEGMHEFAIKNILPRVARVRSSAEIMAALGGVG